MSSPNTKKLLLALAAALASIIAGSLVWYLFFAGPQEPRPTKEEPLALAKERQEREAKLREGLFSELTSESMDSFKNSQFTQTAIDEKIKEKRQTPTEQELLAEFEPRKTADEKFLNQLKTTEVTDEEVFKKMNPPHYLDTIANWQDLLISAGYIRSDERIELNSEENLVKLFLKGLSYLRNINPAAQNDYDRLALYLKTEWLDLRESEVGMIRFQIKMEKISKSSLENKNSRAHVRKYQHPQLTMSPAVILLQRIGLNNLFRIILSSIKVNGALAGWSTSIALPTVPETGCYRDDDPEDLRSGENLWAGCCNCGEFCTKFGCEFFEDCGPYSEECNVPNGCLNAICDTCEMGACANRWLNAIWDEMTGICGCG